MDPEHSGNETVDEARIKVGREERMNIWWAILVVTGISTCLLKIVRYIPKDQRRAVFRNAHFSGLIEPGLRLKLSGSRTRWLPLAIGDQATLIRPGVADFHAMECPVATAEDLLPQERVEISSFSAGQIIVVRAKNKPRHFACVKHLDSRA